MAGLAFTTSGPTPGVLSEKLRIDSSGRLLVAKTSTSHSFPLQIQAASDANAIGIAGESSNDTSEITFYENDDLTILGQIQHKQDHAVYRHRVGYLRFDTGGITERMRIDSSGKVLIGTTSGSTAFAGDANNLVIVESGNTAKIVVHRKTEDAYGGNLRLGKTRSTTSAIDNNDEVGIIEFFGHDSTDTNSRLAHIGCYAEADGATNDVPGRLVLATTADGASTPTERVRIDSSGRVGIGATSPSSLLTLRQTAASHQIFEISRPNSDSPLFSGQ